MTRVQPKAAIFNSGGMLASTDYLILTDRCMKVVFPSNPLPTDWKITL